MVALDDAAFLAELEDRFTDYLGALSLVGEWVCPGVVACCAEDEGVVFNFRVVGVEDGMVERCRAVWMFEE